MVRRESVRSGDHYVYSCGELFSQILLGEDGVGMACKYNVRGDTETRHTIFMVPSQELEQKVSLATRFQWTAKASRLCSCHDCTGNWSRLISNSLMEPSPAATTH